MAALPSLEEQIAMAGITYNRRHDIIYRVGLIMQTLGAAILAVLYPMESPFYSAGIMLFEAGVMLSAVYLLVWMSWIKKIIVGFVLAGIALQLAGYHAPEQYAGSVIIAGIGLVCVGAAGLAGKEAYCFAYQEGWVLMWLYTVMILANLLGRPGSLFNAIGFSAVFLLILSLTGKKLTQPLLSSCSTNVCGLPRKKSEDR